VSGYVLVLHAAHRVCVPGRVTVVQVVPFQCEILPTGVLGVRAPSLPTAQTSARRVLIPGCHGPAHGCVRLGSVGTRT